MSLPSILKSFWGQAWGMSHRGALILNFGAEGGVRQGRVPLLLESPLAASSAISNTVTETLFSNQITIPKNTLHSGSRVKISFQGIVTAFHSTDTVAIKLYIGGLSGTALLSLAANNGSANDIFFGQFEVLIRTNGPSGTFVGWGKAPAHEGAQGTALLGYSVGSTAIDTTAAQVVGVSATWSVANSGDSCRLDYLTVEIV